MAPRKRKPAMLKARTILAFDPGASAGVALFVDGQYIDSCSANGASHIGLYKSIQAMAATYAKQLPLPMRCVIESGFGRGIGAATLDRRRGLCMGAAEVAGFEHYVFISPSTWHAAMFRARDSSTMKSEAMAWCKAVLNINPLTHDQAEACCIGYYAVTHM